MAAGAHAEDPVSNRPVAASSHASAICGERKKISKEIDTIWNEQGWFVWLPILNVKLPVSNRFGNVQPSVMAHRILWNIEQVYVK